ncbi:MAG: S8 family serine peptidase [Prevotellaceae bacterium]|jgi:subtilisin family serine protease|nr:S8 family serine peptidase [Prevotellaceae bacterium]
MKRIFFILLVFICGFFSLRSQQNTYKEVFYYYAGEKIFLTERTDKVFLKLTKDVNKENLLSSINSDNHVRLSSEIKQSESLPDFLTLEVLETKVDNISSVIERYKANINVVSASLVLQYNGVLQGLADEFVVMLKKNTSYKQFQNLLSAYHCVIVEENEFVKNQFLLSVTKISTLTALQLSNLFYETELFEFSEPNFIILNAFNSNDTYFNNQWGLKNTGQYNGTSGIDINAESAWAITNGSSNIKVAVIDEGVDLTHPDLQANLLSGYDASGNNSGGAPVWSTDMHGTACAGIIGAVKDNGKGISGVAPNCKMIPIHVSTSGSGIPVDWAANSIQWAQQNGADVISNSWGGSSPYTPLTNAINTAINSGRNGKGCVVVFATGNDNASSVSYPASLSSVIAVGANTRNGQRADFSNYGTMLDIVAPGVDIYTTDIQGSAGYNTSSGTAGDYYANFGGTSAACPHVAGVAALILSIRPDLTQAQVRQAIESTCTKLSGYSFSTNSNHPNGTWNSQVGHGLVNAYAALQAVTPAISGPERISCTETGIYSSNISGTWTVSSNLQIVSGQGTSSISVRKNSESTYVTRDATISIGDVTKNIAIGPPYVRSIDGPGIAGNGLYYFAPNPYFSSSVASCEWGVYPANTGASSNHEIVQNINNYMGVKIYKPGTYLITCAFISPCSGSQTPVYKYLTVTANDLNTTSAMAIDSLETVNSDYLETNDDSARDGGNYSVATGGSKQIKVSFDGDLSAITKDIVDYMLINPVSGAIMTKGKIPSTGGILSFDNVPAGMYVFMIDTGNKKPESFKLLLR